MLRRWVSVKVSFYRIGRCIFFFFFLYFPFPLFHPSRLASFLLDLSPNITIIIRKKNTRSGERDLSLRLFYSIPIWLIPVDGGDGTISYKIIHIGHFVLLVGLTFDMTWTLKTKKKLGLRPNPLFM